MGEVSAADAVVADCDAQDVVVSVGFDGDRDGRGVRVLGRVGERLGDEIVGRYLDRLRQPVRRCAGQLRPGRRSGGRAASANERPAEYESLFDAVETARPLTEEDIIDESVTRLLTEAPSVLRLDVLADVQDEADAAQRRFDELKAAEQPPADESWTVFFVGKLAFLSSGPSCRRRRYARGQLDRVRRIVALPEPRLTLPQVMRATPSDLPHVLSPESDGPVLGVVDSGVASSHPLLAPAVLGAESVGSLGDGGDRVGHGTLVASLGLYGSLEDHLATSASSIRPCGRREAFESWTTKDALWTITCGKCS